MMEVQIADYLSQVLQRLGQSSPKIDRNANLFLDLNINAFTIDLLFSEAEQQFKLSEPLMFGEEVASVNGLAHYISLHTTAVA